MRKHDTSEEKEEKVVNFLGIKQSWWQVTSKFHSFLIGGYGFWYLLFEFKPRPTLSESIYHFGVHILVVSGVVTIFTIAGINIGDFFMMLHEWYRERRDERRREMEANLRAAEEARAAAEQAKVTAEEARVTEEEARVAAEQARVTAEQAKLASEEARVTAEEATLASEEANAQLRQHLAAWNAWNQRRLRALASGEPFDEPPPNGTERH